MLREAASAVRAEWSIDDGGLFCQCEDSDHWFDRSICPEPCDSMHDICIECGRVRGYCPVATMGRDKGNRLALSWLAVANWLDLCAEHHDELPCPAMDHAATVARAYLGESS